MKRISEIISSNDVLSWDNNIITIEAGTGAGKSYFIKNILYDLCKQNNNKKILMLVHRVNCKEQFQKEIERDSKTDTIRIMTYQKIESMVHNYKTQFDFSEYDYIVCDEFHYFLSDASFNITTDISLNEILSQNNTTRIFMSATGDHMKRYINNIKGIETIDYGLDPNYKFIKELTFYNNDETLEKFADEIIANNQKAIFFIQSAKKAYSLYEKYKGHCLFNCSKSNKDGYYKFVDEEKIENMLINEKFEENILITTSCLDAGVNICDDKVEHVVIDMKDFGTLIQCLGRRRILNEADKIYVYIKNIHNNQLSKMKTQIKNKIYKAEFLKKHTVKEYIQEFPRSNDYNHIVYDIITNDDDKCTKKYNDLMYFKIKYDIGDITEMTEHGDYGYAKYVKKKLKFKRKHIIIEEEYEKDRLRKYLNSILGKKLFKEEQQELIEKINLRVDSKQQRSYSKLNEGLKMIKLKFIIIPKRTESIRFWIVENYN